MWGPSSVTQCDVGQLCPSLRDSGTYLDEDDLKVSREMRSGLLGGQCNQKPPFPTLSLLSPAGGCHQYRLQNKTEEQAAES